MMQMLIMLPMWMNFLLRTYAWMTLLENNGLINRFLGLFGIGPLYMINTSGAVVLGMVYNYVPYMILPLYTIMVKIDQSVIEAAQDLGKPVPHSYARAGAAGHAGHHHGHHHGVCAQHLHSSSAACWAAAQPSAGRPH
ncbi:MAG: ABC transporter permease, partial [Ruthenibacterium sp.]